jgi:hypothetical protein
MITLHDTVERFERLILHADIIKAQRLLHADIIKAQGRTRTSKIGLLQRLRTKLKLRTRLTRLMASFSQQEDKTLHSPIFSEYRKGMQINSHVIVTANGGNYDQLIEPPIMEGYSYLYYCDNPQIMRAEHPNSRWLFMSFPYTHPEAVMRARFVKTHPGIHSDSISSVIWVDANLTTRPALLTLHRTFLSSEQPIGCNKHPQRSSLAEEYLAILRLNKDSRYIGSWFDFYGGELRRNEKIFSLPLLETSIMMYNLRAKGTEKLCDDWWAKIVLGSPRDQLSLPLAIDATSVEPFLFSTHGIRNGAYATSVEHHT